MPNKKVPREKWLHGRRATYLHHKCRCAECRAANSEYTRAYYRRAVVAAKA